jgi:hypothetical protein
MVHRETQQHPMKMVCACTLALQTDSAAMNMAWTGDATSTSFRALSTLTFSSKGHP